MQEFWHNFFGSSPFIPHGHCYLWQPGLVWLHIISDSCIAFAYYSIPITLVYFVQKRKDLPFDWIFLLFGAFIVACGTTHLMEVWTLWHPTYWLSGAIKAVTALVSLYTALELIPLVPKLLALPSPAQLEAANQELRSQIVERERAELQIRTLNAQLEQRVTERTAELEAANQLKDELLVRAQAARAEAETANRMKDNFLAIISHELRTPLNPILGWCKLLMSRKFDQTRIDNAIATIERNAKLQVQLIDDLLDVSRIIQGKLSLNVSPVNLASVILAALETIRLAAETKSIQLVTRFDADVEEVEGDPTRLQQVMWNLLSNAVKFTPQPGQTHLKVAHI
jgi:signal transduction histidine kinase